MFANSSLSSYRFSPNTLVCNHITQQTWCLSGCRKWGKEIRKMAANSNRKYRPLFELCVWRSTPELRRPRRTFLRLSAWPAAPCCVSPAVGIFTKKSHVWNIVLVESVIGLCQICLLFTIRLISLFFFFSLHCTTIARDRDRGNELVSTFALKHRHRYVRP